MAKRERAWWKIFNYINFSHQPLKDRKKIRVEIDRISMLPDEILECILNRLSLKEAIGTTILSSRWRYVWTFLSKLDFDGTYIRRRTLHKKKWMSKYIRWVYDVIIALQKKKSKSKYIRWVNDVIALHKKKSIEEFRINFALDKSDSIWIDKWVRFALAKKVEKLVLNFNFSTLNFYDFLGADSYSIEGFKLLRSITLKHVKMSGEALELLLANSPLLEDLSGSHLFDLLTLRVIRPFPSLKRLEIRHVHNLRSIEIRDANLVYLKYEGNNIPFIHQNVPLLLNLDYNVVSIFGDDDDDDDDDDMEDDHTGPMFASILPQLETFTIHLEYVHNVSKMKTPLFGENVIMRKLKQLVVIVNPFGDESLLPIVNVTPDSPFLERFVVKSLRFDDFDPSYVVREIKDSERSYYHLREVEFVGYHGLTSELELIMYFLHNAADTLKQIVVNTCYDDSHLAGVAYDSTRCVTNEAETKTYLEDHFLEYQQIYEIMKQLTNIVPPKIQLKILSHPW